MAAVVTVLRTSCPECHQFIILTMGDTAAQVEAAVSYYAGQAEVGALPAPVQALATLAIDLARAFDLWRTIAASPPSARSSGPPWPCSRRRWLVTLAPTRSPLDCRPRWGTPRDPARPTLGPRIGEVAARLGRPLMPWQQQVADVAAELDDQGSLYYRNIRILVPRQQGKTALELAVAVHRANAWPDQVITYAAQTRIKAREKWQEDHVKTLNRSPFGPQGGRYTGRLANGNEAIHWRNGSRHGIAAATDTSGPW